MSQYPNLSNHNEALLDVHEERIQRLEDHTGDMKSEVVENTVRLELLNKTMADMSHIVSSISQKMDTGFDGVVLSIDRLSEKLGMQDGRVAALESKETARDNTAKDRVSAAKKLGLWVVAGIATAVLGGIGHMIWAKLSGKV
jgi:hypothetical protein